MKLNESIMKNLKESEGRTYSVVIGFAGFIGVEEEYNVYAMNRGDAVCEALDNPGSEAELDLSVESVEDLGDGNYEVVVSFAGNIGAENNYTVYAESEEEAEMYAIEEAKADLEVLSVDGTEFSYDETFECAKIKKDKNKLEEADDNYTAKSLSEVLEHEDDEYAIKIENRTTGKSTKWLNIEGAYLFGLYHDVSDLNADNIDGGSDDE